MSLQPSNATLQAAAEWYAVLRGGQATPQEQFRWQAWLDASAEHRTAWRYVEDINQTVLTLREIPDPGQAADNLLQANRRLRQRRHALVCIAGVLGVGALGILTWPPSARRVFAWGADYRTATGQQQRIVLAEGTQIWLNTGTALNVDFTATLRRVTLFAGEVFIETARDPTRPFVVDTDQGRMRALGTRFNVRLLADETQLAVYEGAVKVQPENAMDGAIVNTDEQVSFSRHGLSRVTAADPARQAWTHGMLLAHDISLGKVVQELRRYRHGHIGVDDDIENLKVYGSFPLDDTDRALRMLTTVLPVQIHQTLPWWINLEARR